MFKLKKKNPILNLEIHNMENRKEKNILDGRIKLITELTEFKMSLWVNAFGISNAINGEEIIPIISTFNLDTVEEVENTLKVKFRIYPDGTKYYQVEINPLLKSFIFENKEYHTNYFYKTITGKEYE